ncbi:MAG: hypothetical protein AAB943_00550 [Patescibacteria group bacterium]
MQTKNFFRQRRISLGLKKLDKSCSGYTIIETMIAVSIFIVIVIFGTGVLLNANVLHQKSQDMRSIMDNLSFIMEEVSRNIRTGSNYRCINDGNYSTSLDVARSCSFGSGISFEYTWGDPDVSSDQWVYKIESNNLSKSTDGGGSWGSAPLNPDEIDLSAVSGFSILGAPAPSALPSDTQQPLVIIKLVGTITYQGVVSPFSIQTAVSQRLVDI